MKATFDQAFEKAHLADTTRKPEAIRADIAKQEGIQKECIRASIEISGDKRRRLHEPLRKPYENMASNPIMVPVIAQHREKYGAAAVRINELEKELAVSEGARA